jgi:hypothetical protein
MDDEQLRSLRVLLFEEGRNLLLRKRNAGDADISVEQTRPHGYSVRQPPGNFSPAFLTICRSFDGASRTRTGDLLGAIQRGFRRFEAKAAD